LERDDSRGSVTAVGSLLSVRPGERLRLTGKWETDRRFGRQLRVSGYEHLRPATRRGIERYLGSGMVSGIGPELAKRMVEQWGEKTLDVIEESPERLTEIKGIGAVRSRRIRCALAEQSAARSVMLFLHGLGVSSHQATRLHKIYGEETIPTLEENPYRLSREIHGIGFATADRLAERLGWARDSPRRIAAGLEHILDRGTENGHLFLPEDQLVREASARLAIESSKVARCLEQLLVNGDLRAETAVGEEPREIYLPASLEVEESLATNVRRLLRLGSRAPAQDPSSLLEAFAREHRIHLAAEQRAAVAQALASGLSIVTGGPGTGKTTLIKAVLEIASERGATVALAAPTGRAAQRLAEAAASDARTIHRLLEFQPHTQTFARGEERPLEADLVIVDEASMLDAYLADRLLQAIPPGGRLLLVGDADQLPSVGPGKVLADLIASAEVPVVRLSKIFRQARASAIVLNAHRVLRGSMPSSGQRQSSDFFFIPREPAEETLSTLMTLVTERIPSRFGFDPMHDIQVLTPMHRGLLGARQLNLELQRRLNPAGRTIELGGGWLRVGDRVLQLRNNYELEVFNGDVGRVTTFDPEHQEVEVAFGHRRLSYGAKDLAEITLAYAVTIHKSQGSEYPCAVVVLDPQHYMLLQRNLLYTAMTRGRRLVILVGSRRAVARAVRNERGSERFTSLSRRLSSE
ncbi:MAG TPA: ATP-dependent RecD-like DNA helicase, partial [Thermoanaerobaculia bacterium]|nr:ATP-dependent RecD-like DNA helicase [Thermoanaerobaculia bacterium]